MVLRVGLVKAFLIVVGYVILFVIAGVIVSFIFDVLPLRGITETLHYVVWLVAGSFCGFLTYDKVGKTLSPATDVDWSAAPDSGKYGLMAVGISTVVIAIFLAGFYQMIWRGARSSEHLVPDNMPLTITYFVGMLVSMIGGHAFLRPSTTTTKTPP